MTKFECSLLPNCNLPLESKKDKNCTRQIDCRICLKSWHAFCVGYDSLKEGEFNEKAKIFVCDKCNYFVNAVSDIVADKVFNKMNNLFAQLQASVANIPTNLKSVLSDEIHSTVNSTISTAKNKCQSVTVEVDNNNDDDCDKSDKIVHVTSDFCDDGNNDSNVVCKEVKHQNNIKTVKTDQQNCGDIYICSIEKGLSINDISLILDDAGVHLSNIDLLEQKGDFKNKKFIKISSKENIDIFKFKMSFNRSKLNGTWFIRDTPPRAPIEKTQPPQRTGYHNDNYKKETRRFNQQSTKPPMASYIKNTDNRQSYARHDSYTRKNTSYADAVTQIKPNFHHDTQQSNKNISQADFQHFLETFLQNILYR